MKLHGSAAAFFEASVSASLVRLLAGGPGVCALSQIVDGSGVELAGLLGNKLGEKLQRETMLSSKPAFSL